MEAIVVFSICYGPKKSSKYHLDTTKITFSEKNNYERGNIGENASFQGYQSEV